MDGHAGRSRPCLRRCLMQLAFALRRPGLIRKRADFSGLPARRTFQVGNQEHLPARRRRIAQWDLVCRRVVMRRSRSVWRDHHHERSKTAIIGSVEGEPQAPADERGRTRRHRLRVAFVLRRRSGRWNGEHDEHRAWECGNVDRQSSWRQPSLQGGCVYAIFALRGR
jgi:hypothetical protein